MHTGLSRRQIQGQSQSKKQGKKRRADGFWAKRGQLESTVAPFFQQIPPSNEHINDYENIISITWR